MAGIKKLQASAGRARWTVRAEHIGQSLASTEDRAQRSEAAGHNADGLRATGQGTRGAIPAGKNARGSPAAGHVGQRPVRHGQAGPGEVRRSRQTAGSLAGSWRVATGRAAGSFPAAGPAVGWLAAGGFTAGLLAVAQDPGSVLTAAGQAESISDAHTRRVEADGGGGGNVTGTPERHQGVVSGAVVVARHGEISRAGCLLESSECLRFLLRLAVLYTPQKAVILRRFLCVVCFRVPTLH